MKISRNTIYLFSTSVFLTILFLGDKDIIEILKVAFQISIAISIVILAIIYIRKGIIIIEKDQIGIVYKKFSLKRSESSSSRVVAKNNEAGYQPKVLLPNFYWYSPGLFRIELERIIEVPPGEIALVFAHDGKPIPSERILGRSVECNDFQDGEKFLNSSGEKGRQLSVLRAGDYQINTRLFTVITSKNAREKCPNLDPKKLRVQIIDSDKIGIVTTYDGIPRKVDQIACPVVSGHNSFQNPQNFLDGYRDKNNNLIQGCRGLQEEYIPDGSWNLNPWFLDIKQVPLTNIPDGTVGVIVSSVGEETSQEISKTILDKRPQKALDDEGYELVDEGCRGVWKTPLKVGQHAINTEVRRVVIVPIADITLEWSDREKPSLNYDKQLSALSLISSDGFPLNVEMSQTIRINGQDAPKMVSRLGSPAIEAATLSNKIHDKSIDSRRYTSIRDLVTKVLEPKLSSYFYNAVQRYEAIDFFRHRTDLRREVTEYMQHELQPYGVEVVDTTIGQIDLPEELEVLLTGQTIAKKQKELYRVQQITEESYQKLVYLKATTAIQKDLVKFENDVKIAELEELARSYRTRAEADSVLAQGKAEADIIQAIIDVIGHEEYIDIEKLKHLVTVKMPQILMGSSNSNIPELSEAFIMPLLQDLKDGMSHSSHDVISSLTAWMAIQKLEGSDDKPKMENMRAEEIETTLKELHESDPCLPDISTSKPLSK